MARILGKKKTVFNEDPVKDKSPHKTAFFLIRYGNIQYFLQVQMVSKYIFFCIYRCGPFNNYNFFNSHIYKSYNANVCAVVQQFIGIQYTYTSVLKGRVYLFGIQ